MFSTVAKIFRSSDDHLNCNIVLLLQSYHTLLQSFFFKCSFESRVAHDDHAHACVRVERKTVIFRALTSELKTEIFSFISEISPNLND